jgi:hypothetical protein
MFDQLLSGVENWEKAKPKEKLAEQVKTWWLSWMLLEEMLAITTA